MTHRQYSSDSPAVPLSVGHHCWKGVSSIAEFHIPKSSDRETVTKIPAGFSAVDMVHQTASNHSRSSASTFKGLLQKYTKTCLFRDANYTVSARVPQIREAPRAGTIVPPKQFQHWLNPRISHYLWPGECQTWGLARCSSVTWHQPVLKYCPALPHGKSGSRSGLQARSQSAQQDDGKSSLSGLLPYTPSRSKRLPRVA